MANVCLSSFWSALDTRIYPYIVKKNHLLFSQQKRPAGENKNFPVGRLKIVDFFIFDVIIKLTGYSGIARKLPGYKNNF